MSQLTQQETAQPVKKVALSFEEICPIWSRQLAGEQQHGIDIAIYETCIVGEAHKMNGTSYVNVGKK